MNSHTISLKSVLAAAALAGVALLGLLALSSASAHAAKLKEYECQHPLVTGQLAINPKGISPKKACKVVRSLGKFLSTDKHIEELQLQLQDKKSIFSWIQAWNTYAGRFFTSNFGKPANCFGRAVLLRKPHSPYSK